MLIIGISKASLFSLSLPEVKSVKVIMFKYLFVFYLA